jgi:hypothetical protein
MKTLSSLESQENDGEGGILGNHKELLTQVKMMI